MHIAALTRFLPKPDFNSGDRRFVALLGALARKHDVHLFGHECDAEDQDGLEALRRVGVHVGAPGWTGFVQQTLSRVYHLALFEFYHAYEEHAVNFLRRQPRALCVIDSVDVHFARQAAGEAVGARTGASPDERQRELAAYMASDAVIAVTAEDQAVLQEAGLRRPIYVIPNIVPLRRRVKRVRNADVLFVGGFNHTPNTDAVRWFVEDIWPLVRRAVPTARFRVVGSNPPPEVLALGAAPGVEVVGFVPDTGPFLDEASVSVAPLRYGAGMKGKVNEAMASGLPVVTTEYGVQGLAAVPGVHAVVAGQADSFAAGLISLLQHPERAEEIGRAGQELAGRFTPEAVAGLTDAMCEDLARHVVHPVPLRTAWLSSQARIALQRAGRLLGRHG